VQLQPLTNLQLVEGSQYLEQEKVEAWQRLEVGNAVLTINKANFERL
jgi:hypothetical protein